MEKVTEKDNDAGYTQVPHEILEAMAKIRLSNYEFRVICIIIRKTLGWHKELDAISFSQLQDCTEISYRWNLQQVIDKLHHKNIIAVTEGRIKDGRRWTKINQYSLNKNPETWKVYTDRSNVLSLQSYSKESTLPCSADSTLAYCDDSNTKDTIKRNKIDRGQD